MEEASAAKMKVTSLYFYSCILNVSTLVGGVCTFHCQDLVILRIHTTCFNGPVGYSDEFNYQRKGGRVRVTRLRS